MRPPITITEYSENLVDKVYHILDEHYKEDDYYISKTITGGATSCDNPNSERLMFCTKRLPATIR